MYRERQKYMGTLAFMEKSDKNSTGRSDVGQLDGKVRRLNQGLSSVYETTRLLTGPMELQQVLEIVVKTVAEALGLDAAGLRLLDEETGQLILKATYGLSEAYKNKGPVTAGESELNQRALHGEPIIVEDMISHSHFTKYHKEIVREGVVGSLSIGLMYRDKGIGILRLYSKRPRRFSQSDISLAQTVAAQSAAAIVNARLYKEALEGERMARQLRLAGEVQRHLIPEKTPNVPGVDMAGLYVPCYEVGGDFYDFIVLPDDRLVLVIGDVMGKGVAASLAMASLRSSLRAYAEQIDCVGDLAGRANRMFCRDVKLGEFATLFCGSLNVNNGNFAYCNCGHEPPVLICKQQVTDLSEGGMVLGISSQNQFKAQHIVLEKDDMLVMYTDGLADAVNFQRESFGRKRIVEAALASTDMPAEQAAKNILWLMRKFTGLTKRFDDTAIVVLRKL